MEKEHQPLFMSPFIRYCLLIPSWLCDIVFVCVGVPLSKLEEKKWNIDLTQKTWLIQANKSLKLGAID